MLYTILRSLSAQEGNKTVSPSLSLYLFVSMSLSLSFSLCLTFYYLLIRDRYSGTLSKYFLKYIASFLQLSILFTLSTIFVLHLYYVTHSLSLCLSFNFSHSFGCGS